MGSCDAKWDKNGDLDGMWQMTEWRNTTTNTIVKTNQDAYYYSFQQDLIKMIKIKEGGYYLSHFTKSADSLYIREPIFWPKEEKRPMSELAKYGVPGHGRFHIDMLTSECMILSSDTATIAFRKY